MSTELPPISLNPIVKAFDFPGTNHQVGIFMSQVSQVLEYSHDIKNFKDHYSTFQQYYIYTIQTITSSVSIFRFFGSRGITRDGYKKIQERLTYIQPDINNHLAYMMAVLQKNKCPQNLIDELDNQWTKLLQFNQKDIEYKMNHLNEFMEILKDLWINLEGAFVIVFPKEKLPYPESTEVLLLQS